MPASISNSILHEPNLLRYYHASELKPQISGRVLESNGTYRCEWPGIRFRFGFKGRGLKLVLKGKAIWKLNIDHHINHQIEVDHLQTIYDCGSDLSDKDHYCELIKITENQNHTSEFQGIYLQGSVLESPKTLGPKIEFIGNSYMVGYGNTSHVIEPQPETEAELVHQTTDTSQSFAFLTASAFNADMQINAFSGRGLVQNYGRLFRGKEFLWLYPHTLAASRNQSGEESVYDTQSWHPDLIVICMGINDFQGELYAEGPVWQKHYSAFVAKLRLHHPGVKFVVCATSVSPRNEFKSNLKSVIVNEHQKGFNDIHYFEFETDHKGLWYHPTVKGHQRVAQKLTAFIADLMNWEIRT